MNPIICPEISFIQKVRRWYFEKVTGMIIIQNKIVI